MTTSQQTTSTIKDYYERKLINFVLSKRLCDKHMREFIKKEKLKDKDADVVQLLGICSKCYKMGIVYYLDFKKEPHDQ